MARRRAEEPQLNLFPELAPPPEELPKAVGPAPVPEEIAAIAARLPADVHLGPSSWSFPGWEGLVYDGKYSESRLAREGLAAVARHPLIRGVGIDRTHYSPVPAHELAVYADQVPDGFRFLVKAHEAVTLETFPGHPRYGAQRGQRNPRFLDPGYAAELAVAPAVEGLGAKLGAVLFQFAPQDLGPVPRFLAQLRTFLEALPKGPVYAIELRNRELLTPDYAALLAATGAVHCLNAHPRMPALRRQQELTGAGGSGMLVVRWLLAPGDSYETAAARYAPFDRLAAPDPAIRGAIAGAVRQALLAGVPALVTLNNKAEGSAPRSIVELARAIAG